MPRPPRNVSLEKHIGLLLAWIMHRFATAVRQIRPPAHKVIHRPLWPICVKYLKYKTLPAQHRRPHQPVSHRLRDHHQRLQISCRRPAQEVICSCVFLSTMQSSTTSSTYKNRPAILLGTPLALMFMSFTYVRVYLVCRIFQSRKHEKTTWIPQKYTDER